MVKTLIVSGDNYLGAAKLLTTAVKGGGPAGELLPAKPGKATMALGVIGWV